MRPLDEYGVAPSGYRLPADTRLGLVRLQVGDLARSVAFYTTIIGFRLIREHAGTATLAAADGPALLQLSELPGARRAPPKGRLGLYHFAILLPDRAALGRLLRHLRALGVRTGSADHLVSEALYLEDPDGLGIEIYADRARESWGVRNRELVMASDPLDTAGLIEAAGSERWIGLPTGTTIGHVHLHVGSLDQAADFYHRALGLDVMVSGYPGALFLAAGGYHHHLGLNTWAGAGATGPEAADARLLEWTMQVPSAADALAAAGSIRSGGWEPEQAGDGWIATDPWGTKLRILAGDPE